MKVEVEGDVLTLKGESKQEKRTDDQRYHRVERSWGTFQRSFRLPDYANFDDINANFQDGVLKIEVPKKEMPEGHQQRVKSIDIK